MKSSSGASWFRWIPTFSPIATFVLGIFASQYLQDWLASGNSLALGMLVLTIVLGVAVLTIGIASALINRKFSSLRDGVESQLNATQQLIQGISKGSGLSVEYVDDGDDGASYKRIAQLIAQAEESITFVDYWEPFEGYQVNTPSEDDASDARSLYYSTILSSSESRLGGKKLFHRRIVQVPSELLSGVIPFGVDPRFLSYLRRIAEMQDQDPLACALRLAPCIFRLHYILIDRRYVVLPILNTDVEQGRQSRKGALIFDDRTGDLFRCLRDIYRTIDARSSVLGSDSPHLQSTTAAYGAPLEASPAGQDKAPAPT